MPWLRSSDNDIDSLLYGRPRPSNFESPPTSPRRGDIDTDADGVPVNLLELIDVLKKPEGLRMFKASYRENMLYKAEMYGKMERGAGEEVTHEKEIIQLKLPDLKRISGADTSDNWNIFDKISERYMAAKDQQTTFQRMKALAEDNLSGTMSYDDVRSNDAAKDLRDALVTQLRVLANYSAQAHIVASVVDIVSAFLKNPKLIHTKFMNFMMVGPAGTGKTTIATEIAKTFARAGMFVGDNVAEAGRAEFVGEYEGQTVARTRNFLVSNLDRGVIFVDEAYALTQWNKGKPEGYGSEAVTAMVEFMTKYKGLYCLIVAGYEKEMTRYFLPTNPGLTRRFPYRFVLRDMSPKDLIRAFQRHLLKEQGIATPLDNKSRYDSEDYFSASAWRYLQSLSELCTQGDVTYIPEEEDTSTNKVYYNVRHFEPRFPLMYTLFENQAGSMTNLAEEAVLLLMRSVSFKTAVAVQQRTGGIARAAIPPEQPPEVMREIIVQRIYNSALSDAPEYLAELERVESEMR